MNTSSTQAPCPVCHQPLALRVARGRKSGKTFLMLVCSRDGRQFRGFINDRDYVGKVRARLEGSVADNQMDQGKEVNNIAISLPCKRYTIL
jgi:hypothetical protein